MAPQSPKRRKLNSNTDQTTSDLAFQSDLGPQDFENAATRNAKEPISSTKRLREMDVSAPYAGEHYKTSLFKLQVDEMLSEVRPDYEGRMGAIDKTLRKLKSLIEGIDNREPLTISEASKTLQKSHKITIPFPDPKPNKDVAYKLAYAAPSSINVVGSYPLKTMVNREAFLLVDLVVTMPSSIFQEKDYLNYRYFYKRAYYLACLAAGLKDDEKGEEDHFDLSFDYLNGNCLQAVLIVKAGKKSGIDDFSKARCEVRIIPAAPEGFFIENKLRPDKNALRHKANPESIKLLPTPTPFYNATLRADCNYAEYLKLFHITAKEAGGFRDACILGRIWLQQRGFGSSLSKGGFGHFEWATLTALLLQPGGPKGHGVLSPGFSSYQIFKTVVQYLSSSNLAANPMLFQAEGVVVSKSNYPVFYDGPRGINFLFKMSPWSYKLLQEESRISLDMLNDGIYDQFEATFILKKDQPLQQFDEVITIDTSKALAEGSFSDHTDHTSLVSSKLFNVLKEGLADRVRIIHTTIPELDSWALKAAPTQRNSRILTGFIFQPGNINRLVDHGPAAEDKKKAAVFRKFWGQKAELRRFQDGSIVESVLWSKTIGSSIFQEIVKYLIQRHLGKDTGDSIKFSGEGFKSLMPSSANAENVFKSFKDSFDTFEKAVRNLENLPLQVKQFSPISPSLRYTSLQEPVFTSRQIMQAPADVIIQFEGSGRWPDDVAAIQRTKVAFLLKIGELLEDSTDGLTARLGLETEESDLVNCAFLNVIYATGATFRLRIHNDREQTLLDRQIKDKSTDSHTREMAVSAMSLYKRMFIQLPLYTQSVATHCTRFPLLSPTIRLVKKWFHSHMLGEHMREELIELMVCRVFLQPYPWRAPSSTMTGFLRTLQFIARWDWRKSPLIVDFNGSVTDKDVAAITTRLEAWRKIDPAMNRTVLFAASNHDLSGTAYTDRMPSKVVAARMTSLARSACKVVKEQGPELNPTSLFTSSMNEYDFVIRLSSHFTTSYKRKQEATVKRFKNLEVQSKDDILLVGYEPVQLYLEDIRALYTTSMVLFHNPLNSLTIAGLWSPQSITRPLKVNTPFNIKPSLFSSERGSGEAQDHVEIDKIAILAEIARMGGDMVTSIDVKH